MSTSQVIDRVSETARGQQLKLRILGETLLITIAQRFRLKRIGGEPVLPWPTMTLQPRSAVRMRLEEKNHRIAK